MTAWSYSSIKTFDQCPKKYYHLKVAKDVKDSGSEATIYGEKVHKAAEDYVKSGVPVPKKYGAIAPVVETLNGFAGDKYAEVKLGIRRTEDGHEPCDFFAPDVWWRGVADFVSVNGAKAKSVDYKTSKNTRYADMKQLDLIAAGLFLRFPEVEEIKSALAFVVCNEFIHKTHKRAGLPTYLRTFSDELTRLEAAQETDVWNANPSGLCGWCPVVSCEHHRPRRR
jgi:hypothetical protein